MIDKECKQEIIDEWKKGYYTKNINNLNSKIKGIQEDIIRLKSENRSLSNKLKGMDKSIKHWQNRKHENYDDTFKKLLIRTIA